MPHVFQGSILLVDDEVPIVRALHRALRAPLGAQVKIVTCNSGADAIGELMAHRFDVIVSDLRMPNMGGMELLALAADIQPACLRMILTGTADFQTAQQAVNQFGLYRYLTKPWCTEELVQHISAAIALSVEHRTQKDHALEWAASQGKVSAEALEKHKLEAMEPGITRVEWDEEGCLIMPPAH